MDLFTRLERKVGRYAIKDLMLYIVGLNGLVFILSFASPASDAIGKLMLDPFLVMHGEVWRLITFVLIPPSTSVLWVFFILSLYYTVGTGLENGWGSFRFNVYYFAGMLGTAAAAFLTGQGATALYLNLSLFLAFAYIYPEFEIMLFFIVPVKVKYLAWLDWIFIAFTVLTAPLSGKAAALASVVNYLLFFGMEIVSNLRQNRRSYYHRRRFGPSSKKQSIHQCTVCGKTENDDPVMDFRYCSTCEGDHEYCMDHLKNHEHLKSSH